MVGVGQRLSPGEVATRLSVHVSTVQRWEKTWDLVPAERLPSGYRRYDPADVDALARVLKLAGPQRDAALEALREANRAKYASGPAPDEQDQTSE